MTLAHKDLQHFVRVSRKDYRYFELTNGKPYIPIGLNLCFVRDPSTGEPSAVMNHWFRMLAAQGGNFARIWLGHDYFDVEHARSGEYDEEKARHIDQLLTSARRHGIRLKFCIDFFRNLGEGPQTWAAKPVQHIANGGPALSMADWIDSPACRGRYKGKYDFFAKRFGNDPIVFGWELWNEMNSVFGGDVRSWTSEMLPELHKRFPKNLCMQSLGSFESDQVRAIYRDISCLSDNDVAQIHRYLDLGAALDVCHGPVDVLAADAVREMKALGVQKPILLAESGAVEPNHTGPFKLYPKDRKGLILHDVLFAPFFAGAAGPGLIWHWDSYVTPNDLWWHFGRFKQVVAGLDPAAEAFEAQTIDHPRLRLLVLCGRHTVLVWCRDKEATWRSVLAEDREPEILRDLTVELPMPSQNGAIVEVSAYDPWSGERHSLKTARGKVVLPAFCRSLVIRLHSREHV